MVPVLMRFRIRQRGGRDFGLWFPVIIIWILLAALFILALPFALLAAVLTWRRGGKLLLLVYPMVASVLWHLTGLRLETTSGDHEILFDFR
jgi:hypothetical protein